jgi:phenylacetic acid degradation operon negative regulatory protein
MTETAQLEGGSSGPRVSRRHVTGSESARGLLFTVLGEFVLPGGETAWTSAFIDVLGRLGIEEKTSRQALIRTAADGWLESERVGRRTRWRLTASAERLLSDGTERIYSFRPSVSDWDGHWLVIHVRAPETERAARHHLRTRLAWAGCGDPTPGVWISPHISRQPEVERVISDAGLDADAQIFVARHTAGAVQAMVRDAWDLDRLDSEYRQFLADFADALAVDPLRRTVELVHGWRRFPWVDPALPEELLPRRWSGDKAAHVFAHRHAQWASDARTEWSLLNELET